MSPDHWTPDQEQLRFEVENELGSKEASPLSDHQRDPSHPSSPLQSMPLHLCLTPDEQIQQGQVYTLPESQLVQIQIRNQPHVFQITQDDYERRYNKVVRSVNLPLTFLNFEIKHYFFLLKAFLNFSMALFENEFCSSYN